MTHRMFGLFVLCAALSFSACGKKEEGNANTGTNVNPNNNGGDAGDDDMRPPVDITDDTAIADLNGTQRWEVCNELATEYAGPTDVECSTTEVRHVLGTDECVAKLETVQPCATVGPLRSCFGDVATCDEVSRDDCWFLIGDDGGCTPPYLGNDRVPVALSVLPPTPVDCANPGPRQRIPFIVGTTDVLPLVPGDTVNGLPVTVGLTFDSGSFAVRRPRVSQLSDQVCTTDAECGSGFKCAAGGSAGAPNQCTRQSPISFVPETMQLDFNPGVVEADKQLVGVLIENTSLLDGRLPTASGSLHDENGEKDLLAEAGRATDPTRIHRESIKNFLINLASVADPQNSLATIYWFAGQVSAEARPLINEMELEDHWTNDLSVGEALIDAMPEPVPKPANVWQAARAMVRKDFALDAYADYEKFLFMFVDGPNEVWDGTDDTDGPETYEQTLADLQALGVHVFIVHLDSAVDPALIRDVPTYWAGNTNCQDDAACAGAPPCSNDGQCANFETCRPANVYGVNPGDGVTQTPASYCLPEYNAEGRLGPIDYYADLACQTGGTYMYVTEPEQMRQYWGSIASSVNGQYSVEADFGALQSSNFPNGWYPLQRHFPRHHRPPRPGRGAHRSRRGQSTSTTAPSFGWGPRAQGTLSGQRSRRWRRGIMPPSDSSMLDVANGYACARRGRKSAQFHDASSVRVSRKRPRGPFIGFPPPGIGFPPPLDVGTHDVRVRRVERHFQTGQTRLGWGRIPAVWSRCVGLNPKQARSRS